MQGRRVLAPGGYVVVSIPNVAHASVRLALLQGQFPYRDLGLLDATHLRFFTRSSLYEMLAQAGLAPADVRRTTAGPFETELQVRRGDVPQDVVDRVLQDPDATTYQFVLTAVPDDAGAQVRHAERLDEAGQTRCPERRRPCGRSDRGRRRAASRAAAAAAARVAELESGLAAARERLERRRRRGWRLEEQSARSGAAPRRRSRLDRPGGCPHRSGCSARARVALQGPVDSPPQPAGRGLVDLAGKAQGAGVRGRSTACGARSPRPGVQAELPRVGRRARHPRRRGPRRGPRDKLAALPDRPLLIVRLMPVYQTRPGAAARRPGESLSAQLYPHWELCAVDDRRPDDARLGRPAGARCHATPASRVIQRAENGGIAAATNTALAMAHGRARRAHGPRRRARPSTPCYVVAVELARHPETDLLFSDEDKLDADGRRSEPYFKPDFNHELLLGQNCVSHLGVVRTSLLRAGRRPAARGRREPGPRPGAAGRGAHRPRAASGTSLRAVPLAPVGRVGHLLLRQPRQGRRRLPRGRAGAPVAPRRDGDGRAEARGARRGTGSASRSRSRPARHGRRPDPRPRRAAAGLPRGPARPHGLPGAARCSSSTTTAPSRRRSTTSGRLRRRPARARAARSWRLQLLARSTTVPSSRSTAALLLLNNDIVVRRRGLADRDGQPRGPRRRRRRRRQAAVRRRTGPARRGPAGHRRRGQPRPPFAAPQPRLLRTARARAGGVGRHRRLPAHPTRAYREVGGLDEVDLAVAFNDVDFCLRVREAGRADRC